MMTLEMLSTLTFPDGGAPRTITVRVSDLRPEPDGLWSVAVDVVGYKTDDHTRIRGADWVNAIEGAMTFLRALVGGKALEYGGTLDPHILPIESEKTD